MKWVEVGHPNWGSNIGLAFLSAKEIFNSMINKEVNVWVNLNNEVIKTSVNLNELSLHVRSKAF